MRITSLTDTGCQFEQTPDKPISLFFRGQGLTNPAFFQETGTAKPNVSIRRFALGAIRPRERRQ